LYKVIDCLKHDNPVINKKLKEVSLEEGLEIAKVLFETLNKRKDGIGLAANQVGIDAAVAVVNVREPIILINPKVIEQWDEIDYYEGCLSYPKKGVNTKRFKNIVIHTEQEESDWYFSGESTPGKGMGTWEQDKSNKNEEEQRTLEAVCIQHEIDHLNGISCIDKEVKLKPIISKKEFGRNEMVDITDGKVLSTMKWKKAKRFIDSGLWELYIGGPIT
jgi:peptide deformylase